MKYRVLKTRIPISWEEAYADIFHEKCESLAKEGIARFYTFKQGACDCPKQNLDADGVTWGDNMTTVEEVSLSTEGVCAFCGYTYRVPKSIYGRDILHELSKKCEILHTEDIDVNKLDPVWRLVEETHGNNACYVTKEMLGQHKLNYYYPGQPFIVVDLVKEAAKGI